MKPRTQEPDVRDSDEIDLFDLIDDIKAKWYWVIGTVIVAIVLALGYLLKASPVYETEVVYKSVMPADLLQLNQPRLKDILGNNIALSPEAAFQLVRTKAMAGSVIRSFYRELINSDNEQLKALIYNPDISEEQNYSLFAERLKYSDSKDSDLFLKLSFQLEDQVLSAEVLNRFSEYLLQRNREEVIHSVELTIDAQLDEWELKAEQMRTAYQADKQRRLLQLQEAVAIARTINQQKPLYSGERVLVSNAPPLYMMGAKALSAEVAELRARSEGNEDLYINGLPELLWKSDTLKSTQIKWDQVRFAEVDQPAIVPLRAVKPRKTLILALAIVAGGMAGILFALLAAAQQRRRYNQSL
tara:strand:+ start:53536 stop:54606 length:1071 start_codon:yes stop_codon:yes gene_type:complete